MGIEPLYQQLIARSKRVNGCLEWQGHKSRRGYGYKKYKGRVYLTHRLMWLAVYGVWPDKNVLHRCDNPPCMDIDHLFLGTQADNVHDAMVKGLFGPSKPQFPRGEQSIASKLTRDEVIEIKAASQGGASNRSLGKRYGVSTTAVKQIVLGRTWKGV